MKHERRKHNPQDILSFINDFINEHSYPPTIREIGAGMDIGSTNTVRYILIELERNGYISRSPNTARGIVVNDKV